MHSLRRGLIRAFEGGWKGRKTFRYWEDLERTQWLSSTELERIQLVALRNLLAHAAELCPYYREEWRHRELKLPRVESLKDFQAWPVIDRDVIRTHRPRMRPEGRPMRLIAKSTGGSSGVPLSFDLNLDSNDRRVAASFRGYEWAGAGPGTRLLYLWGVPLGERSRLQVCKEALYDRLHGRRVLNSFHMSDARVPEFLEEFQRYRPEAIVAYTNPLYHFARALEEQGLRPPSPRSIVVGAEKLHPYQRELIERVFGAPVFETYGSREFMLIGAECEQHGGLHLTTEHLLVEIVDDEGRPVADGEEGDVVVTDLYNYGMPFIRYRIGDRAIAEPEACRCGRGLLRLRKVVGRRLDILETPDGRLIPGEFFPHLLKDFPAVRRFQVVQVKPDRVELRAILEGSWDEDDLRRLSREVRAVLGPAVRFDVLAVEDIPLTTAGKLRVVVNLSSAGDHEQGLSGLLTGASRGTASIRQC